MKIGDIYPFKINGEAKNYYWVCTEIVKENNKFLYYGITTKEIDTDKFADDCNLLILDDRLIQFLNDNEPLVFYYPYKKHNRVLLSDIVKDYNPDFVMSNKYPDLFINILTNTINNCEYYKSIENFYNKKEPYLSNIIENGAVILYEDVLKSTYPLIYTPNSKKELIILDSGGIYFGASISGYIYDYNHDKNDYIMTKDNDYLTYQDNVYFDEDNCKIIGFVKPRHYSTLIRLYECMINLKDNTFLSLNSGKDDLIHYLK